MQDQEPVVFHGVPAQNFEKIEISERVYHDSQQAWLKAKEDLATTKSEPGVSDDIIKAKAADVRTHWLKSLNDELPYRHDLIISLRAEVTTHLPADYIITICEKLSKQKVIDLADPAYLEVKRIQIDTGKSIDQIRDQFQLELHKQQLANRILIAAKNFQNGLKTNDNEAELIIKKRIAAGQSIKYIMQTSAENLRFFEQINLQRKKLQEDLNRVTEISRLISQANQLDSQAKTEMDKLDIQTTMAAIDSLKNDPTTIQALRNEAAKTQQWAFSPDVPQRVPPGMIRLYRGVKPIAIVSEFMPAPSFADRNRFDEIMIKGATNGSQSLTDEERLFLRTHSDRMKGGTDKFFSHNFQVAQAAAQNGIVYYVDVKMEDAQSWIHGNWTTDIPCVVPWEVSQLSQVFAVGPNAPENIAR